MKKWALILFLLITTIFSFILAYKTDNAPAYYLAIVSLVLLSIAYSVEVLDYRIGGQHISLEKRLDALAAEHKELKKIASSLLRITYLFQDGASRIGGTPDEHLEIIKKYTEDISKYIEPGLVDDINNQISKLDKAIEERNTITKE